MMLKKRITFALLSLAAGAGLKPGVLAAAGPSPVACNLKAFQPGERTRWRALLDEVIAAATAVKELNDGYSLRMDTGRVSLVKVAEWIALERKCCPFFDFQLDLHGEDGAVWLSLRGRDGVKQFIQQDFPKLNKLRPEVTPGR